MKKSILVLVILVLLIALIPSGIAQAKKPLNATTEHTFVGVGGVAWQGTIEGDIEGTITWFGDPEMWFSGQASHYANSWEIREHGTGDLLMYGEGFGSTTVRHGKNSNWRTNDVVTEAYGQYADWVGRHVHQSGNFEWAAPGVPLQGVSIFRVN